MCRFCVNGLPGQDFDMFGGRDSMYVIPDKFLRLTVVGTEDFQGHQAGQFQHVAPLAPMVLVAGQLLVYPKCPEGLQ